MGWASRPEYTERESFPWPRWSQVSLIAATVMQTLKWSKEAWGSKSTIYWQCYLKIKLLPTYVHTYIHTQKVTRIMIPHFHPHLHENPNTKHYLPTYKSVIMPHFIPVHLLPIVATWTKDKGGTITIIRSSTYLRTYIQYIRMYVCLWKFNYFMYIIFMYVCMTMYERNSVSWNVTHHEWR